MFSFGLSKAKLKFVFKSPDESIRYAADERAPESGFCGRGTERQVLGDILFLFPFLFLGIGPVLYREQPDFWPETGPV